VIMVQWEKPALKKIKLFQFIPGPLVVVLVGIILNSLFNLSVPFLAIEKDHLVALPLAGDFIGQMVFPDWNEFLNPKIFLVALTLGLVASLESLLSIEAADRLDPFKRITPLNRELTAQGIGNIVSGLMGGLPVTAVIVRTSANINAGARTKLSTILHGVFLLSAVMLIPSVLNLIPFASLAAILIVTGYKLTKPELFRQMFRKGWDQFIPFVVTIIAILITNLLIGIFIGIAVGLFYVLKTNFQKAITVSNDSNTYLLRLNKDVSFLNKALLRKTFESIPPGAVLVIDGGGSQFIDTDIVETIQDFELNAPSRNIQVRINRTPDATNKFFKAKEQRAA
jgi:MFS superfamily sulfate permease-like transporter